jgi:hypothetical protein
MSVGGGGGEENFFSNLCFQACELIEGLVPETIRNGGSCAGIRILLRIQLQYMQTSGSYKFFIIILLLLNSRIGHKKDQKCAPL